jgi:hypothetical protein
MPKKEKPADGGAVRAPIIDMLAPGSDDDFKDSLPEQTSSEGSDELNPSKPRRKRRSKEEIAAARGEQTSAPVDKRLERAKAKCQGLGLASLAEGGFTMAGKPLSDTESEDVGDQFYLISSKIGGSGDSWLFIVIYTIALLAKLVMIRTELGEEVSEWIKKMFEPKPEKQEPAKTKLQ